MLKSKKMKVVAMMLSGVIAMSVMGGCGKSADKDENGKIMVSIGGWPSKEGTSKDNYEKQKAEYEQANPQFTIVPDNWTFDLKTFYAKAAGGQLPILYTTHFTEASQLISAGYAADLTDTLKKHNIYDSFNKDIIKLLSKDDKVYGFPIGAYALSISGNVDMMTAAGLVEADGTPKQPKDWNELAEFAVKIKQATGKPGFAIPTSNNCGGWIFMPIAWSYGVEFMKKDGDKWVATFNTPEAAAALQYIKDLKWKYDVFPSNVLIDQSEYHKLFGTGNVGMIIEGDVSKRVMTYGMTKDQIAMMAMPSGPKKHVTLLGGTLFAVSNKATEDQIDGALKWAEMSYTPFLSDKYKANLEKSTNASLEKGELIGIKAISTWNDTAETIKYRNDYIDSKANINTNHIKLYNDFLANPGDCELRAEESVCAQELYSVLDNCIQEVLTNKDADCAALLEKANADFQKNYLDNTDY